MTKAELISALDWVRDEADIYAVFEDSQGRQLFSIESAHIRLSPSSRVELVIEHVSFQAIKD